MKINCKNGRIFMPQYNQAFIDGQNLKVSTMNAESSWTVDLRRFRVFLVEKYKVREAYYFIGAYDSKNQGLYDALQRFGYTVVFREHAEGVLSRKKGNVDTDIVFTVMQKLVERERFNKVVLVSGDGDYWKMVDYLIKKGKFEKLLVPNKNTLSSLYRRRTSDVYRAYLDEPATKKKLALKKHHEHKKRGLRLGS